MRGWMLKASIFLNVSFLIWLVLDVGRGPDRDVGGMTWRLRNLQEVIACNDRLQGPRTAQRGQFWVLYNYVMAARSVRCFESITFTTHCDYTFLGNVATLVDRWRAPISLAVHAPGDDFAHACKAIVYARDCLSPLIAELVTFHIFFDMGHLPERVPDPQELMSHPANCSMAPPWEEILSSETYRARSEIPYPVNVARNVARESAVTHYILPADVELYPSPGLVDGFLDLVLRQEWPLTTPGPKVFPLAIFELREGSQLPTTKTQLLSMLRNDSAVPFHEQLCHDCHNIPNARRWKVTRESANMHVLNIGHRIDRYRHWEPIFVGTHSDPLYDERLTWEGKRDKMAQGYIMCVKNYQFLILNNAFLVHKPGIKMLVEDPRREEAVNETNVLIRDVIFPELQLLFGTNKKCTI